MKIPFCELAPPPGLLREYTEIAARVIASGRYINGPEVAAFEQEAARFLGVPYAVGLNSGTDALLIALQSLGVGAGDEVITTPFTFFATAESIARLGATPVFADIDLDSFCLSAKEVERKITNKTKAIVPVHLFGHAAPMRELQELASAHKLHLVEDAAQAFGGSYNGQMLGSIGGAGAFSLFPTKNLGGFGDGGLLVTPSQEVSVRARGLRTHGMQQKFLPVELGYNSRLDELQAALLRKKLSLVSEQNKKRQAAAAVYHELLQGIDWIIPPGATSSEHVYHLYTIRVLDGRREKLQRGLAERQIETAIYYPKAMHQLALFAPGQQLPNTERAVDEVLSLPFWPEISAEAQSIVAGAIRASL